MAEIDEIVKNRAKAALTNPKEFGRSDREIAIDLLSMAMPSQPHALSASWGWDVSAYTAEQQRVLGLLVDAGLVYRRTHNHYIARLGVQVLAGDVPLVLHPACPNIDKLAWVVRNLRLAQQSMVYAKDGNETTAVRVKSSMAASDRVDESLSMLLTLVDPESEK